MYSHTCCFLPVIVLTLEEKGREKKRKGEKVKRKERLGVELP
jgi:hypothetical protein